MMRSSGGPELSTDELRAHIGRFGLDGSPEEMRRSFAGLSAIAADHAPSGTALKVAGMNALSFGEGAGTVLYFHGGGYVFGSPATHRGLCSALAEAAGCRVIAIDYPKAPEHPWPAQKRAAQEAFAELRDAGCLGVGGDSAGGHLALLTALQVEADFCVAFSPNTLRDYRLAKSRQGDMPLDVMNDPVSDDELAKMVFGERRPDEPDQTLVLNDLSRLPPTYIGVGTDEVLRDDGVVFAQAAESAGIRIELNERPGFHLEELFAPVYGPGLASVQKAGRFIRSLS
jgi:acetyl esterase/lipase